ncbi:hypothetical protein PL335_07375 [Sulfitobacter faviae]|uniref:hypothetical protein n=1 Tax=Sulfitobacter faviae TaxID=1775881 RepID=UPI0023080DCC|nr:hypothetical protein [Sulfitobacter faviae]WCE68157.1 hypothetical protein PL335_07375 [Sulfitobacter faviae]
MDIDLERHFALPGMTERIKLGILFLILFLFLFLFLFIVMSQVRRCRHLTAGTQRVPECALLGLCNAPLGRNRR